MIQLNKPDGYLLFELYRFTFVHRRENKFLLEIKRIQMNLFLLGINIFIFSILLKHDNPVNQQKYGNLTWIECIGSPNGLLYYRDWLNGTSTSLNCYFDRGKKRFGDKKECSNPNFSLDPFITTDKEWTVYYTGFVNLIDNGIRTYWFRQTQDTVDGVPLFELMHNTPTNPVPIKSKRFFKEKNGKVSEVYNFGIEVLFYDFNVQLGDTIVRYPEHPLFNLVVVKIDTVAFDDNKLRKRIHLLCEIENNNIYYWIEGMGSEETFLNEAICSIIDGPSLDLRCYYENGIKVYQDSLVGDCLISSTEDNYIKRYLKINPNPVTNTVTIDTQEEIHSIAIYNQMSQFIKINKSSTGEYDISDLPSGLYYIEIIPKDFKYSNMVSRIIKL